MHAEFNEDINEFSGIDYPDISFVDEIMSKELLKVIQEELKILSPIEQETIALRLWEDMQFKEIAQVQNARENTCKWRFYRAIEKLKEQLKAKNIAYSTTLPTICTALKSVGGSNTYAAPGELQSLPFDQFIHNQKKKIMKTPHKSLLTSNSGIAVITGTILVTGVVAGFAGYHLVTTNNNKPVNNTQESQQQSAGTMVTSTPDN